MWVWIELIATWIFLKKISTTRTQFLPDSLNSDKPEICDSQVQFLYNFFNHTVKTSNEI